MCYFINLKFIDIFSLSCNKILVPQMWWSKPKHETKIEKQYSHGLSPLGSVRRR